MLKKEIQQKKNTIELLNDGVGITNNSDNETIQKLQEKLKEKSKKLDEATNDKKRLAKDLAKAEDKLHNVPNDATDNSKFEKMTILLKTKNKDAKANQEEIRKLSTNLNEFQDKINVANNKIATLEAKNVRLEKQCDDLFEALEKDEVIETVKKNVPKEKPTEKTDNKCKKHDKSRCHFGPKCNFAHTSNTVCKTFSKHGFCKDEEECPERHPTGVCLQWRRSICEKGLQCFYQHPDKEHGTLAKEGATKEAEFVKRKRSSSNESSPNNKSARTNDSGTRSTNSNGNFLYERMFAIEKELENQKRRNSVPIPTQPPVYMMAPPSMVPQHPTQTHTAPTAWSTVAACPPPGMSGMMGPYPGLVPHEQNTPAMYQYYQQNQ